MEMLCEIENGGRPVRAIMTGLSPRSFAQSKLPGLLASQGCILRPDGTVETWLPEGTAVYPDGRGDAPSVTQEETDRTAEMIVFGPSFPGRSLLEICTASDPETAWPVLHRSVSMISRAGRAGTIPGEVLSSLASAGPASVVVGEDGSLLFFPKELFIRCSGARGDAWDRENRLLWTHPDAHTLDTVRALGFTAGALAYRIIAGTPPFTSAGHLPADEQLALNIRGRFFAPLELERWDLRQAAGAAITALLSNGIAAGTDTLLAFGPSYGDLFDPLRAGREETPEFRSAREKAARIRGLRAGHRQFQRRWGTTLKIGAAVLACAGILFAVWFQEQSKKPSTLGMKPEDIVAGYYRSIGTLDQEIHKAYTTKEVRTDYTEYVANLYVSARVREAYERNSGIISPAELYADGEAGSRSVYGITGFSAGTASVESGRVEFNVSFYFWIPFDSKTPEQLAAETQAAGQSNGENNPGLNRILSGEVSVTVKPQMSVYLCHDRVTLEYRKDRWMITAITSDDRTLVEGNTDSLLERLAAGTASELPWAPTADEIAAAEGSEGL